MRSLCTFVRLCLFVVAFALTSLAQAREILVTQDRTVIYTGPGKFFRPLVTVPEGVELPIGKKKVSGRKGGEFYKVLVILSNGKKAVGYLPTDARVVNKNNAEPNTDELESFEDYQLSKQAFQFAYSHLKTGRFMATGGFMSFIGPGLYLKGWGGALKTKEAFSPVGGIEFGSDALIFKRWSGYTAAAVGVFVNPKKNALFEGSKNDLSNFLVQGSVGIRYTTKSLFSVSLGGTQAALFNVNNSTVTWGGILTVEMPL